MEHLSYEDYQKFGGKVSPNDFPLLLTDCENYLVYITSTRINGVTLSDSIKRLEVKIIDEVLTPMSKVDPNLASFSDGIDSMSFIHKSSSDVLEDISGLCDKYLPSELLYRGAIG